MPEPIRALIDRYERPLGHYVARLLADPELARDVVQECFLRLCRERPEGTEAELRSWLYTVARNLAFDQRRSRSRTMPLDTRRAESKDHAAPSPGELFEAREESSRALTMLATLPPNQQEVLRLKFQSGLSYKEISVVTKLSTSNVGYLIHVGLKTLREKMALETAEPVSAERSAR